MPRIGYVVHQRHTQWSDYPDADYLRKLSGLAIRYSIELGYHRSASTYRKNSNPLIAEMSNRCFWVAYDIDRVASFILGRPVGIPDDCIDAEVGVWPYLNSCLLTGIFPAPSGYQ